MSLKDAKLILRVMPKPSLLPEETASDSVCVLGSEQEEEERGPWELN